jgi:hypothetical protein
VDTSFIYRFISRDVDPIRILTDCVSRFTGTWIPPTILTSNVQDNTRQLLDFRLQFQIENVEPAEEYTIALSFFIILSNNTCKVYADPKTEFDIGGENPGLNYSQVEFVDKSQNNMHYHLRSQVNWIPSSEVGLRPIPMEWRIPLEVFGTSIWSNDFYITYGHYYQFDKRTLELDFEDAPLVDIKDEVYNIAHLFVEREDYERSWEIVP